MISLALSTWRTDRLERIDHLVGMVEKFVKHRLIHGLLGEAVVLRLTAEFQGFARDLHDRAATSIAEVVASSAEQRGILYSSFVSRRNLNRGSASPQVLGQDFLQLGIDLRTELRRGQRGKYGWEQQLSALHTLRNAIAHGNHEGHTGLQTGGFDSREATTGLEKLARRARCGVGQCCDSPAAADIRHCFVVTFAKEGWWSRCQPRPCPISDPAQLSTG